MGGRYIHPKGQTAQEFLAKNGTFLPSAPLWGEQPSQHLPACIAHNGLIEMGVVCDSYAELSEWLKNDLNPKFWYFIPIEKLLEIEGER